MIRFWWPCAVMFVLLRVTFAVEALVLVCDAHRTLIKFAAVHSSCLKLLYRLWLQPSVAVEIVCEGLCCVPAVSCWWIWWNTLWLCPEDALLIDLLYGAWNLFRNPGLVILTLGHRILETHSSTCHHAQYYCPFLSSVFSWFPLSRIKSSYVYKSVKESQRQIRKTLSNVNSMWGESRRAHVRWNRILTPPAR